MLPNFALKKVKSQRFMLLQINHDVQPGADVDAADTTGRTKYTVRFVSCNFGVKGNTALLGAVRHGATAIWSMTHFASSYFKNETFCCFREFLLRNDADIWQG
jgi:hypothetical protein